MSIRKLYLREDPKAKKAMSDIVRRGIAASPPADKEWGDALLQAVDQFDIDVRSASGEKPKAKAAGKKPAAAQGKPQGDADDRTYDPKKATRTSVPKAGEKPPEDDLDDDWFMDEPELGPSGPGAAPTKAKKPGKAKAAQQPAPPPADDDFPDLPAPQAASFQVGGDDGEEEYQSPFKGLGLGGSSWDDVPAWMRDPEKMPMPGGGSRRIPGSGTPDQSGPSPVGRPWTDKDLAPKKKGLLGRIFGRKK